MRKLAENIWELTYPLSILGARLGRRVTVIRLVSGKLVIHSTGPFSGADIAAIRSIGVPGWLVDVTLNHDTFSDLGRAAFPDLPYGTPEGFVHVDGEQFLLTMPPVEWREELEVLPIEGIPRIREFAFFHRSSRTLIVADLLFNFGPQAPLWTRQFLRFVSGIQEHPGISRLFAARIENRKAFATSMDRMLEWDFDRLIVAHGEVINSGAKQKIEQALGNLFPK